jgi:flagellar hook-basal body complex protein FliE
MSSIAAITSAATPFERIAAPVLKPAAPLAGAENAPVAAPSAGAFSSVLDQLVGTVASRQAEAEATTRQVLLGDGGSLHQSVIAMQEASLALSLMIEVRNKVIDSYQEIMRMPV